MKPHHSSGPRGLTAAPGPFRKDGNEMARMYPQLTFTDSVKEAQEHYGTRATTRRMEAADMADDRLGPREIDFIEARDGFYIASVGDTGWPYVQFRGGPRGFLKVLDERTIAWADFRGNLQYVTTGNVAKHDRMALILLDYPGRKRLKIMARARIVDARPSRPPGTHSSGRGRGGHGAGGGERMGRGSGARRGRRRRAC